MENVTPASYTHVGYRQKCRGSKLFVSTEVDPNVKGTRTGNDHKTFVLYSMYSMTFKLRPCIHRTVPVEPVLKDHPIDHLWSVKTGGLW